MPRARIHESTEARLRAHAATRKAAGMTRKSIDITAEEQSTLDALRSAWGLDSDRAVMRKLIAAAGEGVRRHRP
jgi:hypothetical protein